MSSNKAFVFPSTLSLTYWNPDMLCFYFMYILVLSHVTELNIWPRKATKGVVLRRCVWRSFAFQQVSFPWTPVTVFIELNVRLNQVFFAAWTSFSARPKWCSKSCKGNSQQKAAVTYTCTAQNCFSKAQRTQTTPPWPADNFIAAEEPF